MTKASHVPSTGTHYPGCAGTGIRVRPSRISRTLGTAEYGSAVWSAPYDEDMPRPLERRGPGGMHLPRSGTPWRRGLRTSSWRSRSSRTPPGIVLAVGRHPGDRRSRGPGGGVPGVPGDRQLHPWRHRGRLLPVSPTNFFLGTPPRAPAPPSRGTGGRPEGGPGARTATKLPATGGRDSPAGLYTAGTSPRPPVEIPNAARAATNVRPGSPRRAAPGDAGAVLRNRAPRVHDVDVDRDDAPHQVAPSPRTATCCPRTRPRAVQTIESPCTAPPAGHVRHTPRPAYPGIPPPRRVPRPPRARTACTAPSFTGSSPRRRRETHSPGGPTDVQGPVAGHGYAQRPLSRGEPGG